MQKHAYSTLFEPLPSSLGAVLYYDQRSVTLPYAEDFPKLHYHDRYEVGICEEGEGLLLSGGEVASLSAGDLMFAPPGCRHYSRSLHRESLCRCRFLYLQPEAVQAFLRPGEQQAAWRIPPVLRVGEHPRAARLVQEITEVCFREMRHKERLSALLLATLLLEAESLFAAVPLPAMGEPAPAAAKIAEYLSLHYNEPHTVRELARSVHLSESQLRRQFLAAYGSTPAAWRNELRVRIGAELLRRTALSVAEIADQLGYAAPGDFYRSFRKIFGKSPMQYRAEFSF